MQNTLTTFLNLLSVKHTKTFSGRYFNEHPHKNNLYGLSEMLFKYGIRNAATRIEEKENDIFNITCPFVAQADGDFVVVEKVEAGETGKVHLIRQGKSLFIPVSQFVQSWSGVVLLAETSPNSIEPDYTEHRKKDWLTIAQKSILALTCTLLLGIAYIIVISPASSFSILNSQFSSNSVSTTSLESTLLLLVNLLGIYICYLLVLKQLHIQSRYADKICTLFSQSDCNNVLESDGAKLFGVFGWSEIGMGYFVANAIILLFLPQLIHWLVIVNILSLPFTIWSVWYQKVKARQWCPLCLIVQALLWAIIIINLLFGHITIPLWRGQGEVLVVIYQFIIVACTYAIPVLALNLLLPNLSEGNQVAQLRQEINSIKANEDVFKTLLMQQPFYEVSQSDSQILFGNPDAKLRISILTNPFCNPCAKMHARVENLLKETKGNVCIQYIFSSFNESLDYANRYMIATYLNPPLSIAEHSQSKEGQGEALPIPLRRGQGEVAWQLFSTWFSGGKALKESFFKDLHLDLSNPAIEIEFQKHEAWKEKTQLRATPTILINGYKLPDNYKIEDLRYFTEFDFEIKS